MQKQYLTPELIQHVQKEAEDPIWRMGILAAMKKQWYNIMRISPRGLIHIHGNRDTGWAHIISRHSYYSNDLYFGDGALGDPSRFQPSGVPIFDWVQVADDIFVNGEIDTKEHPDAALFVKYTGQSSNFGGSNGQAKDFILIIYRYTRIVHSLFPKKSLQPDTPKSKLRDFKRALDYISAETTLAAKNLTIRIPYVNSEITERYVIVVRINLQTMKGRAHLQVNWPNGVPRFSIHTLLMFDVRLDRADVIANNIEFTRFINTFTKYGDFAHIEDVMNRTEKKLFANV